MAIIILMDQEEKNCCGWKSDKEKQEYGDHKYALKNGVIASILKVHLNEVEKKGNNRNNAG